MQKITLLLTIPALLAPMLAFGIEPVQAADTLFGIAEQKKPNPDPDPSPRPGPREGGADD